MICYFYNKILGIVEFLPSKKQVNAVIGKNIIDFAKSNGIEVSWSCRKGECKKCEVVLGNKKVLACKTKIPPLEEFPKNKILQIVIPMVDNKKK